MTTSILGIPALFELQVAPTPTGGFISLEKRHGVKPAFAAEAITIPPYSVRQIKIVQGQEAQQQEVEDKDRTIIALAKPSLSELPRVVAGLYTARKDKASVLMLNPTQQQFRVNRKAFVAVIDELNDDTSQPWQPEKQDPHSDKKRTSWEDENTPAQFYKFVSNFQLHHVSPKERKVLEQLLWKKRKAFAKDIFQVGQYNHEQFSIPMNPYVAPRYVRQPETPKNYANS